MRQDLPDHHRVFDTRDYPHTASAVRANFHIYCEYPFQPLGGAAFRTAHSPTLRLTFLLMLCLNRSPVAPASRRHLITPAAVRRKAAPSENPMVARQVHSRLRNQRHQSCNEIQWIEDHVRRSIPIPRLQLVAHLSILCIFLVKKFLIFTFSSLSAAVVILFASITSPTN